MARGALLYLGTADGLLIYSVTPAGATAWAGTERGLLLHSDDRGASWCEAARVGAASICMTVVASSQ